MCVVIRWKGAQITPLFSALLDDNCSDILTDASAFSVKPMLEGLISYSMSSKVKMSTDNIRVVPCPMDDVRRMDELERRIEYRCNEYSKLIRTFNPRHSE